MCGIVGYVGGQPAQEFLLEGLRRLEYRGYDSAGVAALTPDRRLQVRRVAGRIERLEALLAESPLEGSVGIGHTRWATHGAAVEENAHPHLGGNDVVAVVHNGVIENFHELRAELEAEGYLFRSETDTEVVAHRLAAALEQQRDEWRHRRYTTAEFLTAVVRRALSAVRGTYGLAMLFRDFPDAIVVARLGSPLVIGVGDGEHFISSDAASLAGYTDQIVYLADHQVAVVTADRLHVSHRELGRIQPSVERLELTGNQVHADGFPNFMLKEIYEQAETVANAMRGRLSDEEATAVLGGLNLRPQQLRQINRLLLTGCGTSWHAALYGEYVIEELARLPVEVEYASELRYRNPPIDSHTLVFAISQSGETADTLAALREMKRKGHPTLAICNVVGSTIAQEADGGVYLHAGPEIGVASTKAYTAQCVVLALLALYFGRLRHLSYEAGRRIIDALRHLPEAVRRTLLVDDQVRSLAEKYYTRQNFLYLGRHYNFPTALEGALKLKEISYIHAEGYPAAEMKHGPIALVDEHTPSVFIMPRGWIYEKVLSNLLEIKARGGPVIAVCLENDERTADVADDVIRVPEVDDCLQPIVNVIPLQLLAYHIAILRGCDVDKPRNLAKSVTVE
ncbi:MAG: glutamine--fructose-6-phosphate aminotransferase [isomerizing] [Pirellulaceae bacterium]|nr:MAG: glutamine--fructose-6-phosphate aminotransferase [isomerizing] [Pirellulaceae bacterium]GIW93656.1 MAG: glutamine--fructose-6-phosphate aminotransferase [isomerizing] [Pirellulaceae bacterium]